MQTDLHSSSLELGLRRGAFCHCLGSFGCHVLVHHPSHLIPFSPGLPWPGPALRGVQDPPGARGCCSSGGILKCPRFCSWPLPCVFIKMVIFNLSDKFRCLYSCWLFKLTLRQIVLCCIPLVGLSHRLIPVNVSMVHGGTQASASLKVMN